MPTAAEQRAQYRAVCLQPMAVRRYSGSNAGRTKQDYEVHGNARLYAATELIGEITSGDQLVIILAEDLEEANFSFPLITSDKLFIKGREYAVVVPGERSALDGTLIAYAVTARG